MKIKIAVIHEIGNSYSLFHFHVILGGNFVQIEIFYYTREGEAGCRSFLSHRLLQFVFYSGINELSRNEQKFIEFVIKKIDIILHGRKGEKMQPDFKSNLFTNNP